MNDDCGSVDLLEWISSCEKHGRSFRKTRTLTFWGVFHLFLIGKKEIIVKKKRHLILSCASHVFDFNCCLQNAKMIDYKRVIYAKLFTNNFMQNCIYIDNMHFYHCHVSWSRIHIKLFCIM